MNPPDRGGGGPRILFVATDLSSGGGVNKVIRDLAVLFRRQLSADVTVVNARSDRASAYEFPDDISVQSHRQQSLGAYFLLLLRLRRTRPDVVIGSWTQDNILVTLAFLFSRTKVVLVEHSSWHFHGPGIRLLRRLIYPLASNVIVLNRRDLEHYRHYLSDVRLIPDPVSMLTKPPAPREKLIIAVGHLEPLKQFDHAIRAMSQSGLEQEGWSLVIIGNGSEAARLSKLINDQGLTKTRILPEVEDLASWYARASLLLLTSKLESFSLVLAESMLAGVVPIAYATDGPSFILEDFSDNLVPIGDLGALADRLVRFAQTDDLTSLRRSLRSSAEARFSPGVVLAQWRDLLGPTTLPRR